jgi:hypothetical protein
MAEAKQAQYRITETGTGRRLMDYSGREYADAWLATHPDYRVGSRHTDHHEMRLYAIYVEKK